jgi:Family of unknown function (DUF6444)
MDRAEAEAIYDAGREVCVEFILELAARVGQVEEPLARLEAQARQDSRTSSRPPSSDPPRTRAQRRAEARAKAKELLRSEGEGRKAGGQSGHLGAGRELRPEDEIDQIVDRYPDACGGCGREFTAEEQRPRRRFGRHQVAELPPISVTRDRASHASAALSALPGTDQRPGPRADRRLRVRPAVRGGGRDVDRSASDLTPRDLRARTRPVRGHALDRRGRCDLPARVPSARRPAPAVAGLGAGPGLGACR